MENSFSYQPAAGRYERMPYKYWFIDPLLLIYLFIL